MGQRLNIELLNNGKLLANCYWHWKGYTSKSIELTDNIIQSKLAEAEPTVETAIRIFQSLGAGLLSGDGAVEDFKHAKELIGDEAVEGTDRNLGLIAITPESMERIENWEEARVQIDIATKRINFGVMYDVDINYLAAYTVICLEYDIHDMDFATFYDFCHDLNMEKLTEFPLVYQNKDKKYYQTI